MPKIAFYVEALSAGVGESFVFLAWDRYDRGPGAADELDINGCGLYTFLTISTGTVLDKLKTKSPISISETNCPETPDGFPKDYFNRFEIKPGGTSLSQIANFSLEIFEESTSIYSTGPLKVELAPNSIISGEVSIQDRPALQAWEDKLEGLAILFGQNNPAKEIWRYLMTPDQSLEWF